MAALTHSETFAPTMPRDSAIWALRNGETVSIRLAAPEDIPEVAEMLDTAAVLPAVTVLVAARIHPATGQWQIIAAGRLRLAGEPGAAEFSLAVTERFQLLGLGTELLARLVRQAKSHGITRLMNEIRWDDHALLAVCRKLGFSVDATPEGWRVRAEVGLLTA